MSEQWSGRRLLVVVAHPDDETFGCGSVIAAASASGAHVTVCCATRGEAGEAPASPALDGRSLAELRVDELHAAAAVLGASQVIVLDFADSGMQGDAGPRTLVGAPFESVVDRVLDVVRDVAPDVVVTLDPGGGDGHRDHVRIAEATIEAARRWGGSCSVYAWCLVRSLLSQWFAALRAGRPDAEHLELDTAALGRPDADITTVLDARLHLATRRAAMACHRSQRSPYDDMSDELRDAFLADDHLVRIAPPWTGGDLERTVLVPVPR